MRIITHQDDLSAFCEQLGSGEYVTVDTEFIREKTYYPKLCLLQMAGEGAEAIIDPLSDIDLAPVFEILKNPNIVKVFHAARQDVEIFYFLSGAIPAPMFDTQIAASVCGFGESASYETLVNAICNAQVDKSSRFTDWAARPLSEKQLSYALSDVTHLRDIYKKLKSRIDKEDRAAWIQEEHAYLSDPALYTPNPEDAWKRLKFGNMKPKSLAVLRELARWRETEARLQDVPRGRVLKDDTLLELASSMPQKESDFGRMRGMERSLSSGKIEAIIFCVETALKLSSSDYPKSKSFRKFDSGAALPMLQLLLKVQSEAHGTAAPMIASKDDLEAIAAGDVGGAAMQGWRYDIFGKSAEALMQGNLKISFDPKSGKVILEEN